MLTTPDLKSRTVDGLSAGLYYYAINCKRITDQGSSGAQLRLAVAADPDDLRRPVGRRLRRQPGPHMAGRVKFDIYGKLTKPQGDTAKAKAMA